MSSVIQMSAGAGRPERPSRKCPERECPLLATIPRGALLPAGSQFLLVAGRCVSSEREANSAVRVECPCMAMGQAAGAMAALSARTGTDPEKLPIGDVLALLREHGAIVPGEQGSLS